MRQNGHARAKLIWIGAILLTILIVYLSFRYLLPLLFPFVIALFLAAIIRPMMFFLNKKLRIPNGFGACIILVLLLSGFVCALTYLIMMLCKQVTQLVDVLPFYQNRLMAGFCDLLCVCDNAFGLKEGTTMGYLNVHEWNISGFLKKTVLARLPLQTIQILLATVGVLGIIFIILIATVLLAKDYEEYKEWYKNSILYTDLHKISEKLANAGLAYLKAQLTIMSIIAVVCVIGLFVIGNDYALLIGIGIAVVDAFPVLGSGLIIIPWSIVMLFQGNIFQAAILITIYLCCIIIRQLLEPRLIGDGIGIKPVFTLLSIYIGIQVYGGIGFLLGPISLVIIKSVAETLKEKLLSVK